MGKKTHKASLFTLNHDQILGGGILVNAFWSTRCQVSDPEIVSLHLCFQTLDTLSIRIIYSKIFRLFLKLLERTIETCVLQNYKVRCLPGPGFSTKHLPIQSPVAIPLPSSVFSYPLLLIY